MGSIVENCLLRMITKNANNWYLLFGIFAMLSIISCDSKAQNEQERTTAAPVQEEIFKYAVKKFAVKAGEASLTFTTENGLPVIIFYVKAPGLVDEERIYMDPRSFYPVRVLRDVKYLGKDEKIEEIYEKGQIRIVKEVKGKKTEQVLKKEGQVDNIYCFLHRFRMGKVQGETFQLNLPTKTVQLRLIKKDLIRVMDKEFNALYIESDPKQYKLWFDDSTRRMPLRIDGATGLVSASLILRESNP